MSLTINHCRTCDRISTLLSLVPDYECPSCRHNRERAEADNYLPLTGKTEAGLARDQETASEGVSDNDDVELVETGSSCRSNGSVQRQAAFPDWITPMGMDEAPGFGRMSRTLLGW